MPHKIIYKRREIGVSPIKSVEVLATISFGSYKDKKQIDNLLIVVTPGLIR